MNKYTVWLYGPNGELCEIKYDSTKEFPFVQTTTDRAYGSGTTTKSFYVIEADDALEMIKQCLLATATTPFTTFSDKILKHCTSYGDMEEAWDKGLAQYNSEFVGTFLELRIMSPSILNVLINSVGKQKGYPAAIVKQRQNGQEYYERVLVGARSDYYTMCKIYAKAIINGVEIF